MCLNKCIYLYGIVYQFSACLYVCTQYVWEMNKMWESEVSEVKWRENTIGILYIAYYIYLYIMCTRNKVAIACVATITIYVVPILEIAYLSEYKQNRS